jgi:mannose/fructose/N-acetylgalactosamine-specific phosphotransferase system component IIC
MTLTLTNASQEGVISVVGGPALSSIATASVTSTISAISSQSGYPNSLISIPMAIVVAAIAFALYRKRKRGDRKAKVTYD